MIAFQMSSKMFVRSPSDCTTNGLVTSAATGDVITAMIAITVITAKIRVLICSPPRLKDFQSV